jgi:4a-hydroxytetrahydrobiopterin dehydratase
MNWTEENNQLSKTFKFRSFADAISWMVKAAFIIEKMNHHPEWSNVYNKVHVVLRSHGAGNIVTDRDRELAKALDTL